MHSTAVLHAQQHIDIPAAHAYVHSELCSHDQQLQEVCLFVWYKTKQMQERGVRSHKANDAHHIEGPGASYSSKGSLSAVLSVH